MGDVTDNTGDRIKGGSDNPAGRLHKIVKAVWDCARNHEGKASEVWMFVLDAPSYSDLLRGLRDINLEYERMINLIEDEEEMPAELYLKNPMRNINNLFEQSF